jgi:hypothetical protein
MAKIILAFLAVFALFFFGIKVFRSLSGMEKWTLTKYLAYSILCTLLATGSLITFVILF